MHRFFLPPSAFKGQHLRFGEGASHQISRVLRLKPGEHVVALDNTGKEYEVEILSVAQAEVLGRAIKVTASEGEPQVKLTLYQGLLKGEKFELVLQKGTELGVSSFVPVLCQRSVSRSAGVARQKRWEAIVQEAAEQSRRGKLPVVHKTLAFPEAVQQARGLSIMPWEQEQQMTLRQALDRRQSLPRWAPSPVINLFIGPEGGLTEDEGALAKSHGILPVTLGSRILRAETAALVATAAVMYELGELDTT